MFQMKHKIHQLFSNTSTNLIHAFGHQSHPCTLISSVWVHLYSSDWSLPMEYLKFSKPELEMLSKFLLNISIFEYWTLQMTYLSATAFKTALKTHLFKSYLCQLNLYSLHLFCELCHLTCCGVCVCVCVCVCVWVDVCVVWERERKRGRERER